MTDHETLLAIVTDAMEEGKRELRRAHARGDMRQWPTDEQVVTAMCAAGVTAAVEHLLVAAPPETIDT